VTGTVRSRQGGLLEREGEIERLEEALTRATGGDGFLLQIEGPAGIGKSELLGAARELALERDFAVLGARGGELERDFAFGVVRRLFERELADAEEEERAQLLSGSAALARPAIGLGGVEGTTSADSSLSVLHGLYWLTANLAARRPLMIAVDDLHWADLASLRFLHYLAARVDELPVGIVVGARPREPGAEHDLVGRLAATPATELLRPAPLTVAATGSVLGARLDRSVDDAFAEACHSATGGNPFLLNELAGALGADGAEGSEADAARVRNLGPDTVSRSLLLRLARMPAAAGAIASAVAVLGNDVATRHAAALAVVDLDQAALAVDALADAQILEPEAPLNFVHPIVRSAIYADLGPGERSALHARAAELLYEGDSEPELIAAHLLHTAQAGNEVFMRTLREAAAAALERSAADAAVRYLRRALDESDEARADGELLRELGTAEYAAGEEPEAALGHLNQAIPLIDDPAQRAAAWLTLSRTTMNYVGVPEAVAVMEEALEDLADLDAGQRIRLQVELNCLGITHAATYERSAARMDALAEVPGDTTAERLVLCNIAYREGMLGGSLDRTLDLASRALAGGELVRAEGLASNAIHQVNYVLIFCGGYEEAAAQCSIALEDAVAHASAWAFAGASGTRGGIRYFSGDLPGCEADIRQALEAPGSPPFAAPYLAAFLALGLVERGELEEAEAAVTGAWPEPEFPPIVHMELLLWSRARVRAAQGRHSEALADLLEFGARSERVGSFNPAIPWRADAALACAQLGETDRALELANEHLDSARDWGAPAVIGNALRVRGLVVGGDEGLELVKEAVEALAASPARLEHARALVDLGAARRRDGKREAARGPLREGLEAARHCGATALVERAHDELITAGARPRRLMFSGVESLTASERRVAGMAAEGMSNREIAQALFVTVKTVENHLSRSYSKLDISSRAQLAEALETGEGSATVA
jgi:DNA-binding CsgD family transcriptional regulator